MYLRINTQQKYHYKQRRYIRRRYIRRRYKGCHYIIYLKTRSKLP